MCARSKGKLIYFEWLLGFCAHSTLQKHCQESLMRRMRAVRVEFVQHTHSLQSRIIIKTSRLLRFVTINSLIKCERLEFPEKVRAWWLCCAQSYNRCQLFYTLCLYIYKREKSKFYQSIKFNFVVIVGGGGALGSKII